MKTLVDAYGRKIRKLRVSLTDRCNLRCHYCMPEEATFMPPASHLTAREYFEVIQDLCEYGLEEIRLTGGEPLMRKDFSQIIETLSLLPLKKIALTTNALLLERYFDVLEKHRISSLNISLDSLKADRFKSITRRDHFHQTMRNIETAVAKKFHVKINTVVMQGINDDELLDFVELSRRLQVEVRFLEMMRIGEACQEQNAQYLSAQQMMSILKNHHTLMPLKQVDDATAFSYKLENGAQIGFIASESMPFCGHCSRWRLSADGIMRACLLKDDGLPIKNKTKEQRADIFHKLLGMKPKLRPKEVSHMMYQIGG